MALIIPASTIHEFDDEPRIRDLDLATWLGFAYSRQIRELIARNRNELQQYGNLSCRATNSGQRGRPGQVFYLNEGQALVLCALSRTKKAAEVRKALIELFMAYRQGKVVDVQAHRRRKPQRAEIASVDYERAYDRNLACVMAFRHDPDAILSIMAGMLARLETVEGQRATDTARMLPL